MLSALFTWRSAIVDSDLPATTRHVALTLSLHMNERGGSCFPSLVTLARESGRSKSTVVDHLRSLEGSGWLTKNIGGGRSKSTTYTATVPNTVRGDDSLENVNCPIHAPKLSGEKTQGRKEDVISENATASSRIRPVFDALVTACYGEGKTWRDLTRSAQGEVNAAAKQLEELGASAEEVALRAKAYRAHPTLGRVMLTPSALAKHWPGLTPGAPVEQSRGMSPEEIARRAVELREGE